MHNVHVPDEGQLHADLPHQLLTEQDVSKILHISLSSLRRRRRFGQPPRVVRINRLIRYVPADVAQMIEASRA
jgi:predicted DNA-binding transcriptional regulator AlpA